MRIRIPRIRIRIWIEKSIGYGSHTDPDLKHWTQRRISLSVSAVFEDYLGDLARGVSDLLSKVHILTVTSLPVSCDKIK